MKKKTRRLVEQLKNRLAKQPLDDVLEIKGRGFAVLTNVKTGEVRKIPIKNLITNDGDRRYATLGAEEPAYFSVAGARLGKGLNAPAKGDSDVQTFLAGSGKAIDGDYPKTDDDDGVNPGSPGVDVVTWRISYTTGEANGTDITEVALVDNISSPTKALCRALFDAAFDKTSNDTLKIFLNQTANGV